MDDLEVRGDLEEKVDQSSRLEDTFSFRPATMRTLVEDAALAAFSCLKVDDRGCVLCHETASFFCADCDEQFCGTCAANVHKVRKFQSHELHTLSSPSSSPGSEAGFLGAAAAAGMNGFQMPGAERRPVASSFGPMDAADAATTTPFMMDSANAAGCLPGCQHHHHGGQHHQRQAQCASPKPRRPSALSMDFEPSAFDAAGSMPPRGC